MAKVERHIYEDRAQLAGAMALGISGILAGAIAVRGRAVLAVSGGSTPKKFFEALSHRKIDWSKVTILLVDERIVPPTNDRSNAKLVRENLMINEAVVAKLVPYTVDGATPDACAQGSQQAFAGALGNIDALVLGMGTDGHTASFFPNGDNLAAALDVKNAQSVISMQAGGAGEPRLTLTLPVILNAHFIALHIEGEEKMRVYDEALGGVDENAMPVRAVLHYSDKTVNLFWAP